jgi:hypothetical protein
VVPIARAIVDALHENTRGPTFNLIDPCAGLGWRLAEIVDTVQAYWLADSVRFQTYPRKLEWTGVEIEEAYLAEAHPNVKWGDSTALMMTANSFDVAITSPTYGNGMNDYFEAKDYSRRNTYIHRIREFLPEYRLAETNTGRYSYRGGRRKWGRYLDLHTQIYAEVHRVLKGGSSFIVNTKGFISGNELVDLTNVHDELLRGVGFETGTRTRVVTPGLPQGENWEAREVFESIVTYRCVK